MTLKARVEAQPLWWMLCAIGTGFLSGIAAYSGTLEIAGSQVVSQNKVDQWEQTARAYAELNSRVIPAHDRDTQRRRIDRELSQRFSDFLGDLSVWQFGIQFVNHERLLERWVIVQNNLFSPPETTGVSNVFPEYRGLTIKQLLSLRASISSDAEAVECEQALQELSRVERRMQYLGEAGGDLGTDSQRILEAVGRNPVFARWINIRGAS